MPNLFPLDDNDTNENIEQTEQITKYGKSVKFDFEKGEFIIDPTGRLSEVEGAEAWLEWCKKALNTERYRYVIYSHNFGEEFDTLIEQHLNKQANESEIRRMATECLMANPFTKSVDNFTFTWENDTCYFTCEITNSTDETVTLRGSVVIRNG
ncbi:DUF2634 domain-containing protein [Thermoanaerobacterium sp. CMT5567-10]|uniref:DUF2634 domain-containing protein n=1 Tax=Thermoanaerobacterium sp. CMT5567-10 TaxID=3061989 RepID=UPI0026DFD3B2|nr:DUF2634 domain-containing protein [Thermoanaerobacterium sp. CMT5567-10]WKV08207.1 DUF2634 domain-containing protein [Thermoanaerobacterium sp. CMT5567-10]